MVKKGDARRPGHRRRVVDSGRSTTCASARATASPSTAAASTTRPRSRSSPALLRYVDGDYNDAGDVHGAEEGARRTRSARRTTSRSRRACSRRWSRASGRRAAPTNARVIVEKPFGRDLASAQELNRVAPLGVPRAGHLPDRPLPRQGGDPEHPLLPLRQLVPRADLEPQLRRARCRSRWPRTSACRAAASSTRRSARCATSSQNHLFQTVALLAMEPPVGPGVEELRDGKEKVFARDARRSSPTTSCAASSRATATRTGVAPDSDVETFAAVRLHIDSWRWAGVPFYIRAGKNLPVHVHRGAGRAAPAAARTCSPSTSSCRTTPTTSASSSTREIAIAIGRAGRRRAGDGFIGRERRAVPLQRPPRRGDRRTSGCSATRCDGETLLFAREDGVEASWRVVDNVLTDHAPAIPYPRTRGAREEQDRLIEDPDQLARPGHRPAADC